MHRIALLLLVTIFQTLCYGQKIDYTIPGGVEDDISREDYKKIVDIALPIVQKKYKIEFVKEGTIQLAKEQGMQAFNLDNLVLKCVEAKDKAMWKDIIQEYFNQIFTSIDEKKKIEPKNFETVKRYLSIRISKGSGPSKRD